MLGRLRSVVYSLLRKSERYTKTDMVYLAKGGFWLSLSKFFSIGLSIVLSIVLANTLPKEVYGTYRYILSVAAVLAVFSLSGLNTAITRAVARGYDGMVTQGFFSRIRWGLFSSFLSIALAGYYYFTGSSELAVNFLIVAIFLPLMEASTVSEALLLGKKNFGLASRLGMISKLVTTAILIVTLYLSQKVFFIILAYFAGWTLIRLITYFITIKKYSLNRETDQETLHFGKHLTITNVIATIADYIDRLLLFTYLGPVELAIYSFALAPNDHIKGFLKHINILALPKFSEKRPEQIRQSIRQKSILLIILSAGVSIVFIALAQLIYATLFPQYMESVIYFQAIIASLVTLPFLWLITSVFQSQKMTSVIYQSQIITSVMQIIITVALILYFGLAGAVAARIIHRVLSLGIKWYLLEKHL